MSITYNNPDEVVKVKHILSLAEHIAEKIDGSGSSTASKPAPTISATITQYSAATFPVGSSGNHNGDPTDITYNGDGDLFLDSKAIMNSNLRFTVLKNGTKYSIYPFYAIAPTWPVTFSVGFTATDNYKACSIDITITA